MQGMWESFPHISRFGRPHSRAAKPNVIYIIQPIPVAAPVPKPPVVVDVTPISTDADDTWFGALVAEIKAAIFPDKAKSFKRKVVFIFICAFAAFAMWLITSFRGLAFPNVYAHMGKQKMLPRICMPLEEDKKEPSVMPQETFEKMLKVAEKNKELEKEELEKNKATKSK